MRFFRFLALSFMLLLVAGVMQGQDTSHPLLMADSFICDHNGGYGADLIAYDIHKDTCYKIWSDRYHFYDTAPDPTGRIMAWTCSQCSGIGVAQFNPGGVLENEHRVESADDHLQNNHIQLSRSARWIYDFHALPFAWSPVIYNDHVTLAYGQFDRLDHCPAGMDICNAMNIYISEIPIRTWTPEDFIVVQNTPRPVNALLKSVQAKTRRLLAAEGIQGKWSLAWSSDRTKLAIVGYKDRKLGITILDVDADQIIQMLEVDFDPFVPIAWSPDGEWIAFTRRSERSDHDLYKINLKTGEVVQLTNSWTDDLYPAWSPDGEYIAFQAGGMITVMKPDGTHVDVLFEGREPSWVANPEWVMRAPQVMLPPEGEGN